MTGYKEFQAELERLHRQAETARRQEKREALEKILALIAEYDLQPHELGLSDGARRRAPAGEPKYRDPETGQTWTGRGRVPGWLHGKDRAQFEIK